MTRLKNGRDFNGRGEVSFHELECSVEVLAIGRKADALDGHDALVSDPLKVCDLTVCPLRVSGIAKRVKTFLQRHLLPGALVLGLSVGLVELNNG